MPIGILFLLVSFLTPAAAADYCAEYYDGQRTCGIPTYESCLQSVRGVGGECVVDTFGDIPEAPKSLMQRLLEAARDQQTPPAVRDLEAIPPPPQK